MKRKSKYLSKIVNGFEIIDTYYQKQTTYAKTKCVYCGAKQDKPLTNIIRNKAKCECNYKIKKHGKSKEYLYKEYYQIRGRCYNKNKDNYKYYGGRGITMCDEWLKDFENFYNWAINNGYKKGLSIDRINNNGNYEPSNCRWTTHKEQCNNRNSNVVITFNNKTQNLTQWAMELNMPYNTLYSRINYYGWSIEKAFTKTLRKKVKKCEKTESGFCCEMVANF